MTIMQRWDEEEIRNSRLPVTLLPMPSNEEELLHYARR